MKVILECCVLNEETVILITIEIGNLEVNFLDQIPGYHVNNRNNKTWRFSVGHFRKGD